MSDRFFQDLLDVGLLTELGDAPERLDSLKESAGDLAEVLATSEGRAQTIPLTLIGLDPHASEDDPAFQTVARAVTEHWNTYKNRFPEDTPRQLLRAVALEAVRLAASDDRRVAATAWYSAASALPFADLGPSRSVIEGMFLSLGEQVEREAANAWGRPDAGGGFRMPPRSTATAATVEAPRVPASALTETFAKALNEDVSKLQATGSYVQHDPQPWATAFAPQLASAVAVAVNTGLSQIADALNNAKLLSTEGIKAFAEETGNSVRAAVEEATVASAGQELRTKLLWWHQTLYSPAFRMSYREMDPLRAALAVATDAYRLVSTPSPQSVEHIVRETVRAAMPEAEDMTTASFVQHARDHRDVWEGDYEIGQTRDGRTLMLTAALADSDPSYHLGPSADVATPLADLAARTFRDLSAARSAATDA